jgi:SAM-dependent methyltransferase
MDLDEYRAQSRERWGRVARGWGDHRDFMGRATMPVTQWLVDALQLQPGQTILELAGGPGEVGLLAVERVRPGGRLIESDGAEEMVELVRTRVGELGLDDVEPRVIDAEWIDLPTASVDAVVCRWGYMLLADPGAALRETRRVLRPGGRVSLAAWAGPEHNPWSSVVGAELVARGAFERPAPGEPGQFAWADRDAIGERLEEAGFTAPQLETVEFAFRYPDLDTWWDIQIDQSPMLSDTLRDMTPAERDELRDVLDARLAPHVHGDGSAELPAATHVAAADA